MVTNVGYRKPQTYGKWMWWNEKTGSLEKKELKSTESVMSNPKKSGIAEKATNY